MYSWRSAVLKLISCVDKVKVMFLSPPKKEKKKRHILDSVLPTMLGAEKLVTVALWSLKKKISFTICHSKSIMEYQCSEVV